MVSSSFFTSSEPFYNSRPLVGIHDGIIGERIKKSKLTGYAESAKGFYTLDQFLRTQIELWDGTKINGREAFLNRRIETILARKKPYIPGTYGPVANNRQKGSTETVIGYHEEGKPIEPIITVQDFQHLDQYLIKYHDTNNAQQSDSYNALEAILLERIAQHQLQYSLAKEEGKKDFFNEEPGKDLTIEWGGAYCIKRRPLGNAIILKKDPKNPRAKFGNSPISEMDGFAYLKREAEYLFVLETKKGQVGIAEGHIKNNVIKPLQEIWPKATIYYLLATHYKKPEKNGKIIGYPITGKDDTLCREIVSAGARPIFIKPPIEKTHLAHLTNHFLTEYHKFSRLPFEWRLNTEVMLTNQKVSIGKGPFPLATFEKIIGNIWKRKV